VLSHFHGDHFDQIAERELDKSLPIVTTPQAAQELRERGFHNPEPLETWEVWERFKGDASVRITAMPGRHGPVLANFLLPEVMGSRVELISPAGRLSIYISGDTLIFDAVKKIPRRYPHCDLALLHLGGTRILGVLVTMDAAQGLEMMRLIDADLNIPIHYDDYDVFKSSLAEFDREVAQAGLADKVRHLNRGETYEFALRPRHRERRS
jgi:L-ascorbate metabolism protein UlaG (beta-lactamase superfamily)